MVSWQWIIIMKFIILHKFLIGGEAKVKLLEVDTISKTSLNPRVELFVITVTSQVILIGSAEKWNETSQKKEHSTESKSKEKNTTALAISDDDLLFIGDKECLNVACVDCNWVIDSGASYHLTPHQDYF